MNDQTGIAGAADYQPGLQGLVTERRYGPDRQWPRLTLADADKLIAEGGSYNAADLLRQLRDALAAREGGE
jgi:hypothetical protein